MKIVCEVSGYVYKKLEKEYEMNGKSGKTYSIMLDQGDSIETVRISEDIFKEIKQGESYVFGAVYNSESQYAQFAVRSVLGKTNVNTTGTVPARESATK